MPAPSTALSTLRPDIAGSLMEFDLAMDRGSFIWNRVLPVFDAPAQSGKFGRIPVKQLLQNRETKRAPNGGYSRSEFTFTDDSYATTEHGAEEKVDDRQKAMYRSYFRAETIAANRAVDVVLRNAEKRVAEKVFNATTFGSYKTAITNEWDDYDNAEPINDVEAAVRAVWNQCGLWANALIINKHVFRNLRLCTQVQERIASSGAGSPTKAADITEAMLAAVFDLDRIIVAGGTQNSANEGQDVSFGKIWSDEYAMVCRVATTDDIEEPCLGRVFHWSEDGSSVLGTFETYRDEPVRADIVRCRHDVDEQILYAQAGHLLENVTTI